jgi:hypothetical protein
VAKEKQMFTQGKLSAAHRPRAARLQSIVDGFDWITSGGALSMPSKRTSFPVITATASAPGCSRVSNYKQNGENVRPKSALHTCHLNSPGVSVQLRGRY